MKVWTPSGVRKESGIYSNLYVQSVLLKRMGFERAQSKTHNIVLVMWIAQSQEKNTTNSCKP